MDGQAHRDRINDRLADMLASDTTRGTITGGSFVLSESELRTVIKNWLDLADSYQQSLDNAKFMMRVEPPADDFASRLHADAANRSGSSYKQYLKHNRDYCLRQAELSQNALNDYLGVEHTNVTEINKTAPQGPRPRV
jgi:hypothetical protein